METIRKDLARPHDFSKERVGFLYCRPSGENLIGIDYHAVADEDYERTSEPICLISSASIRKVMERLYHSREIVFHVHCHDWPGLPDLSRYDTREIPKLLASFGTVVKAPHGILLLSSNRAQAWRFQKDQLEVIDLVTVGFPVRKETKK